MAKKKTIRKRKSTRKTKEKDPCWKGYHQVGSKTKGGKEVPNCVPSKRTTKKKP